MSESIPSSCLQIVSNARSSGVIELSLAEVEVPAPGENEVTIRVEAAPINPSDLGLLVGPADVSGAVAKGTADRPLIEIPIDERLQRALAARVDEALAVGNEGSGTVVAAGSGEAAQALLGKVVGFIGGATYSQYRTVPVGMTLAMEDGTTPREAAACFVNPLTALGMVETMKREGHTALVHTAAASNLGQMLQKICVADGIDLVNIVRREEQAEILRGLGAKYVVRSTADDFRAQLTEALAETGATIAFDATGGGKLGGQILGCMEAALSRTGGAYSRYGSDTHKQLYIYGRLDTNPTQFGSDFGFAWSVGGWLLTPFLQKLGSDAGALYMRVAKEIKTTFASHYTAEVSLAEALDVATLQAYQLKATGQKYLIEPQRG
ncbi:MAG: NADH oxidase [Deltaproteobacteria bacterium]|nr:NADH oxidase [Deltaproteobacteria bacterium]